MKRDSLFFMLKTELTFPHIITKNGKPIPIGGDNMTNKELIYVEDALSHEKFMKSCSMETSQQLTDPVLSNYTKELEKTHNELYQKFLNLL